MTTPADLEAEDRERLASALAAVPDVTARAMAEDAAALAAHRLAAEPYRLAQVARLDTARNRAAALLAEAYRRN